MNLKKILKNNKDITIIIIGRILQIIIAIFTIRIITNILSPEEYGRLGIVVAILLLISSLFINPIGMYINRFLITWNNEGTVIKHLNYFMLYLTTIAVLSALTTIIIHKVFTLSIQIDDFWLFILIASYIILNVLNMTFIPSINILGNRVSFVLLTIATLIIILIIPIILIKNFTPTMEYWLLGQIIGFGIIAIVGWYVFKSKLNPQSDNIKLSISYKSIAPIIIFAVPLAISVGLGWIQLQSYRFFLSSYSGIEILGLFLAGYAISAAILAALESIVMQYLNPIFYSEVTNTTNENLEKAWTKYAMFMMPTLIVTVIFTIFAAPYLVKILLATSYQNAAQFVLWGAIIEGLRVMSGAISMGAHAIVNTKTFVIPSLIAAMTVITGLFSLPNIIEPTLAVGISLTIGGFIYCIALYIILHKIIKLKFDIKILMLSVILSIPIVIAFIIVKYIYSNPSMIGAIITIGSIGTLYLAAQTIIYLKWSKKYQ